MNDHHSCPLDVLVELVRSIVQWLEKDEENVVAIHCKVSSWEPN